MLPGFHHQNGNRLHCRQLRERASVPLEVLNQQGEAGPAPLLLAAASHRRCCKPCGMACALAPASRCSGYSCCCRCCPGCLGCRWSLASRCWLLACCLLAALLPRGHTAHLPNPALLHCPCLPSRLAPCTVSRGGQAWGAQPQPRPAHRCAVASVPGGRRPAAAVEGAPCPLAQPCPAALPMPAFQPCTMHSEQRWPGMAGLQGARRSRPSVARLCVHNSCSYIAQLTS